MIITLYSKLDEGDGPCPYCDRAREWLTEKAIPFEEVKLTREERQAKYKEWHLKEGTVPQVFIAEFSGEAPTRIGGFDQLQHSRVETLFMEAPPPVDRGPPQYEMVTIKRVTHKPIDYAGTEVVKS